MMLKFHAQYAVRSLRDAVRRFRRDDDASLSVEAVLVMPLLIWAFLAVFTFFDLFRERNLALKGNYAISDLLSRETEPLDMAYLNGTGELFEYLTQTGSEAWIRVTVVTCTDECGEDTRTLELEWSRATDGIGTFTNADVANQLDAVIPWIAEGERVIIVETSAPYRPPFSKSLTGVGPRTFVDMVMTRPRFAPQLCWDGVGCGA